MRPYNRVSLTALALLLVLSLPFLAACGERTVPVERQGRTYTGPAETEVQAAIRQLLEAPDATAQLPFNQERLGEAQRAYAERDYRPIWTGSNEGLDRAEDLLVEVARADQYALNPASYDLEGVKEALERAYGDDTEAGRSDRLAEADLHLSNLFLDFGRGLAEGPFSPSAVDADWFVEEPDVDLAAALNRVAGGDPVRILVGLASRHGAYERLQDAVSRYQEIEREGGFPQVPEGETVRPGESSPRVSALRARLEAEGFNVGGSGETLDGRLADALAEFQQRYGLVVDTLLNQSTVDALNVSAADRVRQIQVNLVRWHWMPEDLGGRYLFVNLPEFRVHAYEDGDEVLSMPIVVGAEYDERATPAFSDVVTYAEFRPYWNVPTFIANDRLIERGPDYLRENHFEIVRRFEVPEGDTLRMTEANLQAVADGRAFLREQPNPHNAMGRVKYMFPNDFAIYLHDTPDGELFDERVRAYSYGCIRLEDPAGLGAFLYAAEGWDESDVRQRMNEGPPSNRVDLQEPVPVFILYLTAFVDENGHAHFRPDLYGYDVPIAEAISERDYGQPEVDVQALIDLLPD